MCASQADRLDASSRECRCSRFCRAQLQEVNSLVRPGFVMALTRSPLVQRMLSLCRQLHGMHLGHGWVSGQVQACSWDVRSLITILVGERPLYT